LRRSTLAVFLAAAGGCSAAGCSPATGVPPTPAGEPVGLTATPIEPGGSEVTVMTHDSFSVSEAVLADFERQTGIEVTLLEGGDTGVLVNKAVLSKGNPAADVLYGVDNTFLSRALDEGIFEPYESPRLESIPDEFHLDPDHRALPVDFGDVCLNYDKAAMEQRGVQPPGSLQDLTQEPYRALLVVENPATSSPGLAFLLATVATFGEDGYLDYWARLRANDVLVVDDWETAYNQEFTRAGGARPIVVSYASSPPAEVVFASPPIDEPPTAAVVADGACFRQVEFVGILAGAKNVAAARTWVDFMLHRRFQEDIPLQMFVFPVLSEAELDPVFTDHLTLPENPATLHPSEIGAGRERWVRAWADVMLR
jgi:thiamine transport system substrate-binding protein